MDKAKPYLSAAFLCEKILQEKDNVNSAIRIVDVFNVLVPPNLPSGAVAQIVLTLFMAFKAVDGPGGAYKVTVRLFSPSGNEVKGKEPIPSFPVVLQTDGPPEQGAANIVLNMAIPVSEFGRFAFHVLIDDEEITRVPFMLRQLVNGGIAKQ
jgi:hypothetical protein